MNLFQAIEGDADIRPLLERGDSPNFYGDFGANKMTPLHLAVYRCLTEVARLLLEAGAHPNCEVIHAGRSRKRGRPDSFNSPLSGMTPVDLAAALEAEDLVELLVRYGGRPGRLRPPSNNGILRHELDKARAVDIAESLVVAPVLRPLVEEAQQENDWDEADRLLRRILRQEGEDEACLHLKIRGLLARGRTEQALNEASLVFLRYRNEGRYRQALRLVRCMRLIDAQSARPYELEMEFLVDLGWLEPARECLEGLLALHRRTENVSEMWASKARFALLCRRPSSRRTGRRPQAWQVSHAMPSGHPSGSTSGGPSSGLGSPHRH